MIPLYIDQHLRIADHHVFSSFIGSNGFVPIPRTTGFPLVLPYSLSLILNATSITTISCYKDYITINIFPYVVVAYVLYRN